MDMKQVVNLMELTKSYYPNMKIENPKLMVVAWQHALEDYPYEDARNNLVKYVKSGAEFPPNVGQLRKKKSLVASAEETKLFLESWGNNAATEEEVQEALANMRDVLGIKRGGPNE